MKIINLKYSTLSENYIIDYGPKSKGREEFGSLKKDELLQILSSRADIHRKTLLYVDKDIPEEFINGIRKLFENTRVLVQLEDI